MDCFVNNRFLRMGSNPGMNSNPGWRNWGQTVMVRLAGAFAAGPDGRAALQLTEIQSESSPAGGLRLPAGKHGGILTFFQTQVKEKVIKKARGTRDLNVPERSLRAFSHQGTKTQRNSQPPINADGYGLWIVDACRRAGVKRAPARRDFTVFKSGKGIS
jgi:hypothetical protein